MKIQIDIDNSTIKIEEYSVSLGELFLILDKLLPNNAWKQYHLISEVITYYPNYPIIYYDINRDTTSPNFDMYPITTFEINN